MKGRFEDYAHVLRVAAIFVVGLAVFLVVRAWLVPDDFGLYGHYRAQALETNRARTPVFAGAAACVECHEEPAQARASGAHAKVSCESCHGALGAHASGESDVTPQRPDARATCVSCHDARAGKPARFPQVDVAEHAPEGACSACHTPHAPGLE